MADYGVNYNIAVNTGDAVAKLAEMTQALNAFVNDAQAAQSKLTGKQTIGGTFGNMANSLGLLTKNISTVKEALTSMQKLVDGVGQKQFHVNGKFEIAGLEQLAGHEKQFADAAAVFEKVKSFNRDYNVVAKFKTSQNGKETLNIAEITAMTEAIQKLKPLPEKMSRTLNATVKITAPEKSVMNSTTTAFMQLSKLKDKTNKELNVSLAFNEKQKGAIEQLKALMATLNQSSTFNMKFNIQQAESALNGLKTIVDTVKEATSSVPVTMNGKNAQNVLEKLLAMARELKGLVGSIPVTFVNNTGTGPKPAGGNGATVPSATVLIPGNPQNAPPKGGQTRGPYFKKNGELSKRSALMIQAAGSNGNMIAELPAALMPYGFNAWWGNNGRGIVRNIMAGNQYGFPFHTLPASTWVPSNMAGLLNAANIIPLLPMAGGMMQNALPSVPAITQQSSVINVAERVAAYQRMLGSLVTNAMVANTPIAIPQYAESLFGSQYGSWNRTGTPLSLYRHNIGYQNGTLTSGFEWVPTEEYIRQGGPGNTFLRRTILPGFKVTPAVMENAAREAQIAHNEQFISNYRDTRDKVMFSSFAHRAYKNTQKQTEEYKAIEEAIRQQEFLIKQINEARARNAALYNAGVRGEGSPVAAFNNVPNGGYYNPNNMGMKPTKAMLPWQREHLEQQRKNAALASARRYEEWWATAKYKDGTLGQVVNDRAAYNRWVASGLTPIRYQSGLKTGLAQWDEDEYGKAVPLSRADYRKVMSRGGGGGGRVKAPVGRAIIPQNIGYRILGPSMIDGGGIGAISMLKGMGVMYGITGLGSLIGGALRDYVEFENTMKTAENILKSHYDGNSFAGDFNKMSSNIRNIGKETKFTAPEVASAAKFLAMAGLQMEDINAAIRPVANISLVGDTDLGLTADLLTNVLTGYKIPNSEIDKAADIMTNTFTMSNTTLTEMAEAFKYSAPLLSAGGVDFSLSSGALGILGNAGIKGSQAGTTLRTIMANIINPTKKQQAEWDRLGVARFDENGNLRSLTDIFGDLNAQNLFVDSYYKLFHKTAAQGAVALAAGVDRWNEIVRENFLSDGIANRLAEEKKNTLQGLWAQFTSVFTDDTLDSFAGVQNIIRKMLKDAIDWMNTADAKKQIESVLYAVGDIVDEVRTFSSVLLTLWERFGGFIKLWMQLQMILSAVLIPFRALRSLFNFGMGIAATARDIGNMITKLGSLSSAFYNASNAATKFNVSVGSTGAVGGKRAPVMVGFKDFLTKRTRIFTGGRTPNRPSFQDYSDLSIDQQHRAWNYAQSQYTREEMLYQTRYNAINPVLRGIGGMAGGALGAYWGSKIGENGSQASMWGALGGGLVASGIGYGLAGLLSPFLAANPIIPIIVAVAAALGSLGYAFYSASNSAAVFTRANDEAIKSLATIDGVNISASASELDKRLAIQRDTQKSLNDTIADYITLRREQMRLDGTEKGDESSRLQTEGERNPDYVSQFKDTWGWWNTNLRSISANFETALSGIRYDDITSPYNPDESLLASKRSGNVPNKYYFLGKSSPFSAVTYSDENDKWIATARYFSQLGANTTENGVFYDKYMEYRNALLKTATVEEFNATVAHIRQELQNWQIDPKSYSDEALSPEGLSARNNYFAVERFRRIVKERLNNPNDAYFQTSNLWRNILLQNESGSVKEDSLYAFIANVIASSPFDKNKTGGAAPFSPEWWEKLGYYGNEWHGFDNYTAEDVRLQIVDQMNRLNSLVGGLMDSRVKSLFSSVLDPKKWAPALEQNIIPNTVKSLNGKDYQYNLLDNMWKPVDGKGKSISRSAFDALLERTKSGTPFSVDNQVDDSGNLIVGGGNGGDGNGGGSGGFQPSQYASVRATPKQVIVNIQNLMSLDSVNVNDPKYADTDLEPLVTAAMNRLLVAMNDASESIESRI